MALDIKVYSTPLCPWCKKAKQLLGDNKISFTNIDVSSDKEGREEMIKKSGQISVPVIDIGGQILVGYDEPFIKQKLGLK